MWPHGVAILHSLEEGDSALFAAIEKRATNVVGQVLAGRLEELGDRLVSLIAANLRQGSHRTLLQGRRARPGCIEQEGQSIAHAGTPESVRSSRSTLRVRLGEDIHEPLLL
jgi:hypothetical protein